jgi:hypothetical protein
MAQRKKRPDAAQEQLWRERIELWRCSGQTQRQFCQAHGIAASSLSRWKIDLNQRELAEAVAASGRPSHDVSERTSEALSWTEVCLPAQRATVVASVPDSGGFEVMLPWGWSVRLGPRFEAEALRRLLSVLEERSC